MFFSEIRLAAYEIFLLEYEILRLYRKVKYAKACFGLFDCIFAQ